MENKKVIISGMDYVLPEIVTEQIKIVLIDVNGTTFEGIFFKPNTKQILEMEGAGEEYVEKDEKLFIKKSKTKKIEWILDNLLSVPAGLKIEHLNKLSALELADTFR